MAQCAAISDPKSQWQHFCPNLPAAYLYTVFFGLTSLAHIVQMFVHRKPYSWVISASGLLQTAAYVLRVLSIQNVENSNYYSYWFILMMVAPIWTNAYAYMVMGRMVYNFTPTASVFKVKAWRFGLIFVLLDVLAFFMQAAGAVIASGEHKTEKTLMMGIHIYMGGIGFQQLCIFLFLALAVRLHKKLRLQLPSPERSRGLLLLYVEYAVVGLITVRIIFRLIEYSAGIKSTIPKHEVYQYIFDSTLMLIASVLFNAFHPGRLMSGREANLPTHKERKTLKKQGQVPRGRVGEEYLLPKYENPSEDVSGKSVPMGYEASRGHYARLSTPSPAVSPPRGNSFDGQPETLATASPPRTNPFGDYSYPGGHHPQGA